MRISRLVALFGCAIVTTAACSAQPDDPPERPYPGAFIYGSDGNVQNGFGAQFKDHPGMLHGMKGTAPAVRLDAGFRNRLTAMDSGLNDTLFAGETYDAVVIVSIAAQLAGSTDPKAIAKQISGVTVGANVCTTVADCLAHARAGRDPAYRGATLRHGFTPAGEPSTASYGIYHFGSDNRLDDGKTEYLNTGNESAATNEQPPAPVVAGGRERGQQLVLGGLLPVEGGLSFAYPPMIAGARLALKEVNEAGGVLGQPVQWRDGNDFTDPAKALATVQKHKSDGVHVIIGAGASGVSLAVLPEVVKAGMILFSSSNTAAALSTVDDAGLYFRSAPSDILQARALADVMLRDGLRRICIVARGDAYGEGLMKDVQKELVAAGVSEGDIRTFKYEVGENGMLATPGQVEGVIGQIADWRPDGVLVIGFEESAEVIKGMAKTGLKFRR
ncbi:ABC transporter substrate-binding protein [Allorhizocola rhizosphaerae]|uniref:ABC transporter substrate-binding protein n=1 Tax=Allorhizocola rhizosphaerae TaxID=1872709 RepID=UPI000E3CE127|nr:ABC transporter substrate-binding protein [Allorhizocola rhizosphaerae]